MIALLNPILRGRLFWSVLLSMLLHALLLALPAGALLPQGSRSTHQLEVHLLDLPARASPSETKSETGVLSLAAPDHPAQDIPKVEPITVVPTARVPVESARERGEPTPQVEKVETAAETPAPGVAHGLFPKFIGLPWAPNLQVRPVQQHEMPPEIYRQLREEDEARQRRRTLVAQMTAALTGELSKNAQTMSGRCRVFRAQGGTSLQLDCESSELDALLRGSYANALDSLLKAREGDGGLEIVLDQNGAQVNPITKPVKQR